MLAAHAYPPERVALLVGEWPVHLIFHVAAVAVDGTDRRPDVVRERGERAVLGARRPFADAKSVLEVRLHLATESRVLERNGCLVGERGEKPFIGLRRGGGRARPQQSRHGAADHQRHGEHAVVRNAKQRGKVAGKVVRICSGASETRLIHPVSRPQTKRAFGIREHEHRGGRAEQAIR